MGVGLGVFGQDDFADAQRVGARGVKFAHGGVRAAYSRQFANRRAGGPVKISEDLDRYERVIAASRPEVIVETGSYAGASARWFRQWAPVISVDIDHGRLRPDVRDDPGITWVQGNSATVAVIDRVRDLVAGRPALVSLDSDHDPSHVYAEMCAYAPLVPPGGYMVVEDGVVEGLVEEIGDFLAGHPDWTVDAEIEQMHPVTLFPSGWLRREGVTG